MLSKPLKTAALALLALGAILALPASAAKPGLSAPEGRVILTVSGRIGQTNGDGVARFDRGMLESLGMSSLQLATRWTEGQTRFEGILARDLMAHLGAEGTTVHAVAINDYAVDIPMADFENYPVLLALKMNGEYMRVRDRGPIWVIYPADRFEELQAPIYQVRQIWQLKSLEVR